ncbi:hypothetical protein OG528_29095 [Streptomyces platensis]|uniref:hypothetical protein n=1 Tax=Streptomyces platensis TaxID=58346 RepID=UPI0030E54DFA
MAVTAALCLAVTPAQADSPGGGGRIMPNPPPTPDPWSTPEGLDKFLSSCGQSCTVIPTQWAGEAREGTPTRKGDIRHNCGPAESSFSFKDENTNGETTVVGISLGANPASVLPKIEHSWIQTETQGTTDTVNLPSHHVGWIDEVPVTRKVKGTWKLEGQNWNGSNYNEHVKYGPREFTDVEADITYKIVKHQVRPMNADELKQCANANPG